MQQTSCDRCILDVIAGIDLFHVGAVAARPEISGDVPPAGYVRHDARPRPAWMIDEYLATAMGTAEAVNALAVAIVGSNEWEPPAAAVKRRQPKGRFTNGRRPADYTPDCPTPAEIRERCAVIRATWLDKEHERRMTARSDLRIVQARPKPRIRKGQSASMPNGIGRSADC
jgi:hypothetical protein